MNIFKIYEYELNQRNSDSFINATQLISQFNSFNQSNKRFKDFMDNNTYQQAYFNICEKLNVKILHESKRGKGGCIWCHEELIYLIYNWLHKLPYKSTTRNEFDFCDNIEEAFKGILTFERQKKFDGFLVDLFCEEIHLCIEFDEKHHLSNKEKDAYRQKLIEDKFNVNFIRHNSNDNYSICINKIIRYKESFNIVNAIKNNKIPQKGTL